MLIHEVYEFKPTELEEWAGVHQVTVWADPYMPNEFKGKVNVMYVDVDVAFKKDTDWVRNIVVWAWYLDEEGRHQVKKFDVKLAPNQITAGEVRRGEVTGGSFCLAEWDYVSHSLD